MCGIAGLSYKDGRIMDRMLDTIMSRGPDGRDLYLGDNFTFGHNLLAITENPQLSNQPMSDNKLTLVYNGEIFNAADFDIECKTDCDTELLFKGLRSEGADFLSKLDAMFALAYHDSENNTITLARDKAGVKPLYYYIHDGKLVFASSIKAILSLGISRTLNKKAAKYYLAMGYVPAPLTIFSGIYKLCPGEVKVWCLTNQEWKRSYFLKYQVDKVDYNSEEFREIISQSVQNCLVGRRKISLFLSGGLDSSMILHEASKHQKLDTFTTRFICEKSKFNSDADVASELAKIYGTNHTDYVLQCKDFVNNYISTFETLEEPRNAKSLPVYYLMNREMARQGTVVTLSGDGGDEIFTGYKLHRFINRYPKFKLYVQRWADLRLIYSEKLKQLPLAYGKDVADVILGWFPKDIIDKDDFINAHLWLECYNHLCEDYLIRNDQLGMNFSMEGRFPLTTDLCRNYVMGIKGGHKTNRKKKGLTDPFKILPKNAYNGILPNSVINKEKSGWSLPTTEWLSSRDYVKQIEKPAFSRGFYEPIESFIPPKYKPKKLTLTLALTNLKWWAKIWNVAL